MISFELVCRRCGWRTVSGREDAIARLRLIGQLRRDRDPEDAIVSELFVESAPRMTCPVCKEKSLYTRPADEQLDDGDWQAAMRCEVCRQPIPPERLEAIPGAERCSACQSKAETGQLTDDEPEYCPQCGALVELRVSRGGGITRYKRFCTGDPACRL
jgi:Prokaryotic dksA/traR C4-type zinc finger